MSPRLDIRTKRGSGYRKMPPTTYWGLIGVCVKDPFERHVIKLKSVDVKVVVRGFVAKVTVSSTYQNATDKALEVEFRMPIDEGAAVYKFEAIVNERKITAHCMKKKKAEDLYKKAVKSGHTAVLAREDELTADILHMALGNLPPGSKAELQLSMIMELKVKTDGAISFTLPTVLHPRYCPADVAPDQHTASVAQYGSGPFGIPEVITVSEAYTIEINAKVSGGHAIAGIISHTDALNVSISDDATSAEITQDGGFKPDHDWGMLVYYSNPYKAHIIRETGDRTSTGLMQDDLVMINLHPEIPQQSYSNRNEIIFIVDRSGSMGGFKIQSARATLLLFLKALPRNVFFNVLSFGSSYSLLFPKGSEIFNEANLAKAIALQETMDADMGGTEILQPLKHVYGQALIKGHARQIILLSDGEVFNVDQVMQLVSRHAHETRVFAVGIGHGASTALINGLARAGHGRSEMVYQQDKLQLKVMGLVMSMLQENIQSVNVAFDVDPPCGVKLVPKVPPVIFGGQHLILYTRVPSATTVKSINIKGVVGKETLNIIIQGSDIITAHDEDMTLHRLAARSQINQWQIDEEEDVAEDMIALSVASGVVSRLTALVGVDQDNAPVVAAAPEQPQFMEACSYVMMSQAVKTAPARYSQAVKTAPARCQPRFFEDSFSVSMDHCLDPMMMSRSMKKAPLRCSRSVKRAPAGCIKEEMTFSARCEKAVKKSSKFLCFFKGKAVTKSPDRSAPQMACKAQNLDPPPSTPAGLALQMEYCSMSVAPPRPPVALDMSRCRVAESISSSSEKKESEEEDGFMAVVKLQKFDGSWLLDDAAKLTDLTLEQLRDANIAKNELAWATAVILALLKSKFADQEDLWVLLSYKARDFITNSGEDADTLVNGALVLFKKE